MNNDEIRLRHIADAIGYIEEYTEGMGISEFLKDNKTRHAVISQFHFIGEAANHLSGELTNKYQDVDWHKIVALRNIIVHEYFSIDYSIVWDIIENFLQSLKIKIIEILEVEFNTNK
ncbi:MAG: DUF86 domain-containing protein [Ignavibacteria bacterium]|nr:DUF86 domain-containing protein [Ignavibacteria bacterium]